MPVIIFYGVWGFFVRFFSVNNEYYYSGTPMNKPVLFFSKFCQFSNEVINIIRKTNSRSKFMFVCVEDQDHQSLPKFVDCVPLVFTTDKRILKDDLVYDFIRSMNTSTDSAYSSSSSSSNSSTEFQCASEFSNNISDRYSFVDDLSKQQYSSFMPLDMCINGEFPKICNENHQQGGGDQAAPSEKPNALDNILFARETEFNQYKENMQNKAS